MKLTSILFPSLAFTAAIVHAAAIRESSTPASHPCAAYPTKVSKLYACATSSAYCESYLNYTPTFTRTLTVTKTVSPNLVRTTVKTSTTSTETVYVATTTFTASVSTSTVTVIQSTTTTFDGNCAPNKLKARSPEAAVTSSCGLPANAAPSEISGACQCILATATTIKTTTTTGTAPTSTITKTITVQNTDSITSTVTTVGTTTSTVTQVATACADSFYLTLSRAGDSHNDYVGAFDNIFGSLDALSFVSSPSQATLFMLDMNQHLISVNSDYTGNIETSTNNGNVIIWEPASQETGTNTDLVCSVSADQQLTCTGSAETVFTYCDNGQLGIEKAGGTNACPVATVYVVASDGA